MSDGTATIEAPARPAAKEMAQINVRIDRELKRAGDAALAEAGITPSEIVRDLWAACAERGETIERVTDVLRTRTRTPEQQTEIDRKLAVLHRMSHRFEEFGKRHGLSLDSMPRHDADEDWHEAVWAEREEKWRERGLM